MTDAEISRRLALAIGWKSRDVRLSEDRRYITVPAGPFGMRRQLDYRDPAVIWPIAERCNKWPRKEGDKWKCDPTLTETVSADTASKAVALAVIRARGKT